MGGGLLLAPEAEHSLESGHGRASAVEAEGELVEVDLQVLLADAAVGALQPGLEVAYHPMDAGKDLVRVLAEQMMRTLAAGGRRFRVRPRARVWDHRHQYPPATGRAG